MKRDSDAGGVPVAASSSASNVSTTDDALLMGLVSRELPAGERSAAGDIDDRMQRIESVCADINERMQSVEAMCAGTAKTCSAVEQLLGKMQLQNTTSFRVRRKNRNVSGELGDTTPAKVRRDVEFALDADAAMRSTSKDAPGRAVRSGGGAPDTGNGESHSTASGACGQPSCCSSNLSA